MHLKKLKPIWICILLLGGCTHVSKDEMAQVLPPVELDASTGKALTHDFFAEGGWPTDSWWEMFGDPQLNEIMLVALAENPTLKMAREKIQLAEQEAKKERSSLFPKLGLNYDENWDYFSKNGFIRSFFPTAPGFPIPATVNDVDLSLNFSYEFDFFGRNRRLFAAAIGKARAERAEAQMARLTISTLVAQTYVELQIKLAQARVLKEHVEKRAALYQLTTARSQKGLDAQTPVLEREQSIYEIEQSLIILEKEIALDLHLLGVLAGFGPEKKLIVEPMTALFDRPFPLPEHLSSNLLSRRPDLTAQIWRVESAAKGIGAAKADFYPRVNLMAFAGLESLSFHKLFQMSSKQGGLEPALYLPIFTGGRLTANLKSKVAAFNEAVYHYNELVLSAAREVADQIATLTATYRLLESEAKALDSVEGQLVLQHSRYAHAVSNYITVIEKEESVLKERYKFYGYERDYMLAVVKLIKALGGGYTAPLAVPVKEAMGGAE